MPWSVPAESAIRTATYRRPPRRTHDGGNRTVKHVRVPPCRLMRTRVVGRVLRVRNVRCFTKADTRGARRFPHLPSSYRYSAKDMTAPNNTCTDGTGLQPLFHQRAYPGAAPQAGMGPRLRRSRRRGSDCRSLPQPRPHIRARQLTCPVRTDTRRRTSPRHRSRAPWGFRLRSGSTRRGHGRRCHGPGQSGRKRGSAGLR